ncbi:MAG TPA: hypothetical protein ENN51_07790, partial [candidate division WOR-3 bacterium]|nr:hypothetical protein [candidate division WOR-3 bacterium]
MRIKMTSHRPVLLVTLALWASVASAFGLSGEAQGWLAGAGNPGRYGQAGLQYRPGLSFDIVPRRLDVELAATGRAGLEAWGADSLAGEAVVRPYRAWLRLRGARYEARAGLQKLAFGPGVLLRPLQWFDAIDPRDPTGTTGGVWGLLGRCWFPGNATAWAWGLIGNSGRRQWEVFESARLR